MILLEEAEKVKSKRNRMIPWLLVFALCLNGWNPFMANAEGVQQPFEEEMVSEGVAAPSVTDAVYHNSNVELLADKREVTLYPGESYRFNNTSTSTKSITNNGSTSKGIVFDYVTYNADGRITSADMNHGGNVSQTKGASTIITVSGMFPVTFSIFPEVTYSLSSTPALQRVTLHKEESYIFTNEGNQSLNLQSDASSGQEKRYDFAVYTLDGTLDRSDFNSVSKPGVGIGNEIIVTGATINPVTVGFPYDMFNGEYSAEPAYTRIIMNQGQSYQFTNVSSKTDTLESDGKSSDRFDYVVYLPDGTEYSRGTNTSNKPSVAAGRTAVLTMVTANPVTFGVPYRTFDVRPTGGSAISRITVYPGDTYVFYNNGSLTNPIRNDASKVTGLFDFVIYRPDDTIYRSGFNQKGSPSIPSLGYAVVSNIGYTPIVFDYTDDFAVEESAEPAFERVTLNRGESYEFTNISTSIESLDSDASSSSGRLFDYVTYYEDGTERSRGKATSIEPKVYPNNKAVVTAVSDNPVTFGAIYTVFQGSGRPNEAISQITLNPGESYIFRNHGTLSNPIKNNASKVKGIFDYVMYKADGSRSSDAFNRSSSPQVPKQGYANVTVAGSQPIVFDYTDDFTVEPSTEPAYLRVTLSKGESFSFTNVSMESEYLESTASLAGGRTFDYVIYDATGAEHSRRAGATVEPKVPPGYKAVVTTASDEAVSFGGLYRVFRGQDDPGEIIEHLTIYPNESYVLYNNGPDVELRHNADVLGGFMDYALYRSNGTLSSDGFNVSSKLEITSQSHIVITNPSSVPILYEYTGGDITAEASTEPAFHRATLNQGQSYQFTNISTIDKAIVSEPVHGGRTFDYVLYDGSGVEIDRRTGTSIEPVVAPGNKVIVTVSSDSQVLFGAVYRLFQAEPAKEPVGETITVRQHESVIFTNPETTSQMIKTNAIEGKSFYDYAIYGPGNKPEQAQINSTDQEVTIPARSTLVVTVNSAKSITYKYSIPVIAEASDEKALLKKELAAGELGKFTNTGQFEAKLLTDASVVSDRYYDYRVLDAIGNVIREETETDEEQIVPNGASLEVTISSSKNVLFAGPSRSFTFTEMTDPFIDLLERRAEDIDLKEKQENYYRFKPEADGLYRFVVKESKNFEKEPQLTLYTDAGLTDELATTVDQEREHGWDYTVLEWELKAGQVYYLKLVEKDGAAFEGVINSALMILAAENKYHYSSNNRLSKVILRTGDEILYEYDNNGNVTKRSKKVFPF
ncbi:hypothetical protein AM231_08685 [Paenibacillus solani]|uniref:Uncharacterized protein n=1 Tax=Paenibacillus solani TaxID=1705565 RepID=A0A0M1P5A3_9BACL|nr:hypothetical protein AM231_08685 [Paenibacillus solani]